MENIITKSCKQFGTVRQIKGTPTLWCGSDVAKALGYTNPNKAVRDHCRAITKRSTPISGKFQEINYIPEADVYRLICHSKLPKAQEFEQWVFEDVIPEAVNNPYEQLAFDSYEYFDKTYNRQPVLSILDISKMTGIKRTTLDWNLREKGFIKGVDYFQLYGNALAKFKNENPKVNKMTSCVNIVTKSGFTKLCKIYGIKVESPKCFRIEQQNKIVEQESVYTPHDSMVSLLGYIDKDIILISEYRRRLLQPCSMKEAEQNRKNLVKALKSLKWFAHDTETIILT